jgi:asparagine synthase (glutamine-hydrolysing)
MIVCGIAGLITTGPIDSAQLVAMTRAIAHRGPDGEGLFVAGSCERVPPGTRFPVVPLGGDISVGFGHRRLAIVDISSAGHQPMSRAERYWITFNGEIYNYLELRAELVAAGYHFHTATDTEVILAAYEHWGIDCLERFNGMWAFAILDLRERMLFLARDRLGVKPLYITQSGRSFYFASEIKAFHKAGLRLTPNRELLGSFIVRGHDNFSCDTAFAEVRSLPRATYVYAPLAELLAGSPRPKTYWVLEATAADERVTPEGERRYADRYLELLTDAVRLRLRADVPVGSALSGGLDSSSIVSLVNEQLSRLGSHQLQRTFSSVYRGPEGHGIDESVYIRLLTSALRVDGKEVNPRADQVRDQYSSIVYAMDEPVDSTNISGWFTFKLVSQSGVVVTLDGQGADEQLAGYLFYFTYWLSNSRDVVRNTLQALRNPQNLRFAVAGAAFNLLRRAGLRSAVRELLHRKGKRHDVYQPLNLRLRDDTLSILPRLLHFADRSSMAHAIESRMPFLDYRLMEFCASIPASYKLHDGWTKYVARSAMQGRLPDSVTWRKNKQGWPSPDRYWFGGELRDWACSIIDRSEMLRSLGFSGRAESLLEARAMNPFIRHLNVALWHELFCGDRRPDVTLPGRCVPARTESRMGAAA